MVNIDIIKIIIDVICVLHRIALNQNCIVVLIRSVDRFFIFIVLIKELFM